MVFGAATVRREVYARQGSMSPPACASWPIIVALVPDSNTINVVKVTVRQSDDGRQKRDSSNEISPTVIREVITDYL